MATEVAEYELTEPWAGSIAEPLEDH